MKRGLPLALLGGFLLTGCEGASDKTVILKEMFRTYLLPFLGQVLGWTLLSALAGFILAVPLFLLLRRLGVFECAWRPARWFRWATLLYMIVLLPLCGAWIGFYEGMYRSGERIIAEALKAEEEYLAVGKIGADLTAGLYLGTGQFVKAGTVSFSPGSEDQRLQEFRQGLWELNVEDLERHLGNAGARANTALVQEVKGRAHQQFSVLESGVGGQVLDWTLQSLTDLLLVKTTEQEISVEGSSRISPQGFLVGMKRTAALAGDPQTLTHSELSAYIVQAVITDPLLGVLRPFVRQNQIATLVILGVALLLPPAFFRGIDYAYRLRAESAAATGTSD